jgi:NADH dehydrogenase [ubiquinone] 1 alpha subcomplex assembly factor 7
LAHSIDGIQLVEASPVLREKQHRLLCGSNPLEETPTGYSSLSKHTHPIHVNWLTDAAMLPLAPGSSPFFLAHEFFDALPIHVFTSVPESTGSKTNQWRELQVDIAPDSSASTADFALTQASSSTPHSQFLPSLIPPRYSKLLSLPAGTVIEISPESLSLAGAIAKQIGSSLSGGALFMDYGPTQSLTSAESIVPVNSLRGIHNHTIVSPFWGAGNVDLSASVDFGALASAALQADGNVEVHGHITQANFLRQLGGEERTKMLIERAKSQNDVDAQSRLMSGWSRLVDQGIRGMGNLYQVMAIVPAGRGENGGVVGFGGVVS